MQPTKPGYICSALTELPEETRDAAKAFYSQIADGLGEVLSQRPWVPHEHFDPIAHAHFTPDEVKQKEKHIVCEETGFLMLVALEPTWGGGIEVGWAEDRGIPIFTLVPGEKLKQRKVSRLLLGCSTVIEPFDTFDHGIEVAQKMVKAYFAFRTNTL